MAQTSLSFVIGSSLICFFKKTYFGYIDWFTRYLYNRFSITSIRHEHSFSFLVVAMSRTRINLYNNHSASAWLCTCAFLFSFFLFFPFYSVKRQWKGVDKKKTHHSTKKEDGVFKFMLMMIIVMWLPTCFNNHHMLEIIWRTFCVRSFYCLFICALDHVAKKKSKKGTTHRYNIRIWFKYLRVGDVLVSIDRVCVWCEERRKVRAEDRKSTRLNSSH